jgi:formylglycine-generating enzyme required for sulfatase activity
MRAAAAIGLALLAVAGSVRADDLADWQGTRQARFEAFKPANGERWDSPQAPPLVVVPAGVFAMGPSPGTSQLRGNELPPAQAAMPKALAVGKYPITVGEFAAFVANTGWTFEAGDGHLRHGRSWRNPGIIQSLDDPVLCVSLPDVAAYVGWLKAKTGLSFRLPTEAEYEYVNRAGTGTAFWWGDEVGANHTVCAGCGSPFDDRRTAPVGSFPPNGFGLYDTTGNAWVWTADCYVDPKAPASVKASADGTACEHAIRGGAWHGAPAGSRVFSRFHHTPDTHSATLGFRLVLSR